MLSILVTAGLASPLCKTVFCFSAQLSPLLFLTPFFPIAYNLLHTWNVELSTLSTGYSVAAPCVVNKC